MNYVLLNNKNIIVGVFGELEDIREYKMNHIKINDDLYNVLFPLSTQKKYIGTISDNVLGTEDRELFIEYIPPITEYIPPITEENNQVERIAELDNEVNELETETAELWYELMLLRGL